MKQFITAEQWNELNLAEKETLIGIFQPIVLKYKDEGDGSIFKIFIKNFSTQITIGIMIEFLGDYWYRQAPIPGPIQNDQLCNALWEAVKIKLKESFAKDMY